MDSATVLRGARSLLRCITLLAEEQRAPPPLRPLRDPAPARPSPSLLRGPIVPPADAQTLPPDVTLSRQTCDACGAVWQPQRRDLALDGYRVRYGPDGVGWHGRLSCPVCAVTATLFIARFQRCAGWAGRRGWRIDRLTGRTVRYGRHGWEERKT